MSLTDPRTIYILLSLPIIFGVTLIGDGITKLIHENTGGATPHSFSAVGWISLTTGLFLIALAVLVGLLFPTLAN